VTLQDTLLPLTSGSLLVTQFDSGEKPILAFGIVPVAAIQGKTELTFIFDLGKDSGHSRTRHLAPTVSIRDTHRFRKYSRSPPSSAWSGKTDNRR